MGHWGQTDGQTSKPLLPNLFLGLRGSALSREGNGCDSHVLIQGIFRYNVEVPSGSMVALLLEVQGRKASLVPVVLSTVPV